MAEASIFLLIAGSIVIAIFYALGINSVDPRIVLTFFVLLLIPGFYAAITSGPFVPSSRKRHKTMLDLADLKPTDVVYDLGCGDGRLIFRSVKFCKKAIGYELSIPLYLFGKMRQLFNPKTAQIRYGNIWKQDYKDANVIFCYLLPNAMKQFYKEVWPTLKPGTRVISNAFQMHEIKPTKKEKKVYLYEV
ncbi:class I SAM-dependent methyltransferase [candidate division KSB1 bacterium]